MKIKFALIGIFLILTPSLAMAQDLSSLLSTEEAPNEYASFSFSQLKYDPYPAEPGEYMTLWMEVYNDGTDSAESVIFELVPEYPFSLDPNEVATREFSNIPGLYTVVLQYKIRVDKNAVEGWNEIKIAYKIGNGPWVGKTTEISVAKPTQKAELKVFYVGTEPKAYPGSKTTLSVDLANIASGTAYYTVVGAYTNVAEIEVGEIFVGTMDADDFDTIDFDLKINGDTVPGRYPVTVKYYYKDDDNNRYESEDTVYVKVYSTEEVMSEMIPETPWWQYLIYLVVGLALLKYFIAPALKKAVSFLKKRKK